MALPKLIIVAPDLVTYTCPEPGCPICYRLSKGYFLAARRTVLKMKALSSFLV